MTILVLTSLGFYFEWEPWNATWYERTFWTSSIVEPNSDGEIVGDDPDQFAPSEPYFDMAVLSIPVDEIRSGGVLKDAIPALTNPRLSAADTASYLSEGDRVIGIVAGGEARAYPLKIIEQHEIINDDVNGVPLVVTYCPLCDSSAVFDRRTRIGIREFGVSGLLYNSNVLMYDRGGQPQSLWSQVMAAGVSGPANTKMLDALPLEVTTWKDWRSRHPDTKVLSTETGHHRNYDERPYARYYASPDLAFSVNAMSDRLPPKAQVLGVWIGDVFRAYPNRAFGPTRARAEETLGGKKVVIEFNEVANSLRVSTAGDGIHWMYSYWFAWYAMHPNTEVFEP